MQPTTAEVLTAIGADGIIVGSVAMGKRNPKDVDLVVKERGEQQRHNAVFQKLIALYPEHIESEVPGHLVVHAEPLLVELFEYACYPLEDPQKDKRRMNYRQAKRISVAAQFLGVPVRIIQKRANEGCVLWRG